MLSVKKNSPPDEVTSRASYGETRCVKGPIQCGVPMQQTTMMHTLGSGKDQRYVERATLDESAVVSARRPCEIIDCGRRQVWGRAGTNKVLVEVHVRSEVLRQAPYTKPVIL